MISPTPTWPPRGVARLLIVAGLVLVIAVTTFEAPAVLAAARISGILRGGVQYAGEAAGRCWASLIHACHVAEGSIRLLARIDQELSPTPPVVPSGSVSDATAQNPHALLTVHLTPSRGARPVSSLSA